MTALLRAKSVHYRTINTTCTYCMRPATIVRTTIAHDGSAHVATMCSLHAHAEIASECSTMRNPGTSDFYRREPGDV